MRTFTLAAITLAASNHAFAFDSYGGFASPDNSGRASPIPDIVEPVVSPVIAPVSRGQLVAGKPDSDRSTRFDATGVARPTAPAISSLAVLTHGKPDSGTGGRLGVGPDAEPMVEEGDTIAAETPVEGVGSDRHADDQAPAHAGIGIIIHGARGGLPPAAQGRVAHAVSDWPHGQSVGRLKHVGAAVPRTGGPVDPPP